MKHIIIALTLICFSQSSAFALEALGYQTSGRFETELSVFDKGGVAGTARDESLEFQSNLRLRADKSSDANKHGIEFSVRSTDKEEIDAHTAKLMSFYGFYETDKNLYELGDVSLSANPYVFSGSAKGFKHSYKGYAESSEEQKGLSTQFMFGTQEASWKEFYANKKNTTKADRLVAALETKYRFASAQEMAITIAGVHDRPSTIADNSVANGEALNLGYDLDWRFNRYVTVRGDLGLTFTDDDVKSGRGKRSHKAIKLKVLTKPLKKSLKTDLVYERVDPGYAPIVASAGADREKIELLNSWRPNRKLRVKLNLKRSSDNLEGHLDDTQIIKEIDADAVIRPDFFKRGDISLKAQRRSTEGRGTNSVQSVYESGFNVRPWSGFKTGLSWVGTVTETKSNGNKTDQHAARTNLSYNKKFKDDRRFNTSIKFDWNVVQPDGPDQQTFSYGYRVGYDHKENFSLSFDYADKNALRDNADDSFYTSYYFRGAYYPGAKRSNAVIASFERRVYDHDDDTQEYTEDIAKLSYMISF